MRIMMIATLAAALLAGSHAAEAAKQPKPPKIKTPRMANDEKRQVWVDASQHRYHAVRNCGAASGLQKMRLGDARRMGYSECESCRGQKGKAKGK